MAVAAATGHRGGPLDAVYETHAREDVQWAPVGAVVAHGHAEVVEEHTLLVVRGHRHVRGVGDQ